MRKFLILFAALFISTSAQADETALTIYSKAQPGAVDPNLYRPVPGQENYQQPVPGYAVVRTVREVELPYKDNILKFGNVAALLDPTTVQFKSLTDPKGTKVAEQNYQFDVVSQQKLLQRYINQEVEVERALGDKVESVKGILLGTNGGLMIKDESGKVSAITQYSSVKFPDLPGGLITKPTLVWEIITGKTGKHKTEVSYQTDGITWWADYNLTFAEGKDANSGVIDLNSWVSILNQSGATYRNAKLKLMAGDVNRIAPLPPPMMAKGVMMESRMAGASAPAFAEKAFFEYHLYTLNRPATIPDNSTKQLELIPAATNVPVEKMLTFRGAQTAWGGYPMTDQYYGVEGNKKVEVVLKLSNKEANGLGKPLPAGRVRVNQRDNDGSLEFIGENVIDHTARNEDILIKLGNAFDVVGERKQTNFTIDTTRKVIEEEIEVKLRNQKKQPVKIRVIEPLYRAANWEILSKSDSYTKENSNTLYFDVNVAAESEKVIKYKVRYTW